jgi:hypothetical protein
MEWVAFFIAMKGCIVSKYTPDGIHAGDLRRLREDKMTEEALKWQIDVSYASQAKFKKFNRNHALEYSSCFANLHKVLSLLNSGHELGSIQLGFLRAEGGGLLRIGQTGVPAAKESRLYVYFIRKGRTVYILGIGTKEMQQADIAAARRQISKIGPRSSG